MTPSMTEEKAREIVAQFKHASYILNEVHPNAIAYFISEGYLLALDDERKRAEPLLEYLAHEQRCILTQWSQGEPTPDGGYRTMYAGKWYQTKPINETPKCDCGLDDLYSRYLGKEK